MNRVREISRGGSDLISPKSARARFSTASRVSTDAGGPPRPNPPTWLGQNGTNWPTISVATRYISGSLPLLKIRGPSARVFLRRCFGTNSERTTPASESVCVCAHSKAHSSSLSLLNSDLIAGVGWDRHASLPYAAPSYSSAPGPGDDRASGSSIHRRARVSEDVVCVSISTEHETKHGKIYIYIYIYLRRILRQCAVLQDADSEAPDRRTHLLQLDRRAALPPPRRRRWRRRTRRVTKFDLEKKGKKTTRPRLANVGLFPLSKKEKKTNLRSRRVRLGQHGRGLHDHATNRRPATARRPERESDTYAEYFFEQPSETRWSRRVV